MATHKNWDFLQLPRPQYAATGELLISSLVWSLAGTTKFKLDDNNEDGIVYQKTERGKVSNRKITETYPEPGSERSDLLKDVIASNFDLGSDPSLQKATKILGDDLVGNVPAKANSKALVPLTVTAALMQDPRGMTGVNNPPNFARILQRMYVLGGGKDDPAKSLVRVLSTSKPLVSGDWLDKSIEAMAPAKINELAEKIVDECTNEPELNEVIPEWFNEIESTPYHWFANAWDSLINGNWIEAMPRRRWIDWMSCILRTVLGSGYVFEMNFYYQLVLAMTSSEEPSDIKVKVLSGDGVFFQWNAIASISTRDVASKIRRICERGTACRTLLQEWVDDDQLVGFPTPNDFNSSKTGLEEWILSARDWYQLNSQNDSLDIKSQLVDAISGKANRAANNVYETINYALQDRGSALDEDLYSLMKKRGRRYTVIEPGQEWFAVIASLTAKQSGQVSRVANLLEALDAIGIEASYKTITLELERVGLGRSSHDADDAIEIAAAF